MYKVLDSCIQEIEPFFLQRNIYVDLQLGTVRYNSVVLGAMDRDFHSYGSS